MIKALKHTEVNMTFNEKLLSLRRKSGLSQEELAEKLSVSRQAVSRWENGETLPDAQNLLVLSDIFGVSVDSLLRDEKQIGKEENDKPVHTVSTVNISTQNNSCGFSRILQIIHRALPPVFMGVSGYLAKDSIPVMAIFWLVAVFTQFSIIITQKENFSNMSANEQKTFFQISTSINIFISAIAFTVFFGGCPIFNIFIYVVLLQVYSIFAFEASLFLSEKAPYLKDFRLKFYRINIWFFSPALAALTAQTVMLFATAQNGYLVFAAALAALLFICACVFAALQKALTETDLYKEISK